MHFGASFVWDNQYSWRNRGSRSFLATMLSKQSAILPKLGVRNINSIIFYMHVRNVEVYTRLMQGIYF